MLAIKETSLGSFNQQLVRRIGPWKQVGTEASVGYLRSQQVAGVGKVAVLQVGLISALMQIRCARLGSKSVQTVVFEFLGKHCERSRCRLMFADIDIKLGVGIKLFRLGIALKRRQAKYRSALVAIFHRLGEGNAIFYNWTGEGEPWRSRSDPHDRAIQSAKSRKQVLSRHMKFVEVARPCLDIRNRPGEFAVLGVIWGGEHLYGRNHINGDVDRAFARCGVRNICTIEQRSIL